MLTALVIAAAVATTPIPLDRAQRAFEEARLASEQDGGKLWGAPLYGPILLADPATRFVVANTRDAGGKLAENHGVFTGTLEKSVVIANTAMIWSGTHWTMLAWNFVPSRTVPIRRLILHECWHRLQESLGFPATDAVNSQLDTLEGRYWIQLELRALAAALRSNGEAQTAAIADALAFRARRQDRFQGAAENERALENNEGLAEYTGWALRGTTDSESRSALAQTISSIDANTTFARSFAYDTGPAYGLLLDALANGWTRRYRVSDSLASTLAAAIRITPGAARAEEASKRYGGDELRAAEERREIELQARSAKYRALLIDGPTLELPMTGAHYGFDPLTVITIPNVGSVYPTLEITAPWGTLHAAQGALIPTDYSRIIVPATERGSLELNTGWKIVPGSRPGDYRVSH